MNAIQTYLAWLEARPLLLWGLGLASLAAFVATLVAIPWIVVRLPASYFRHEHPPLPDRFSPGRVLRIAAKNLAGAVFILAGLAMLILPGQGILTLLIGVSLINFPGKRALEKRLVSYPRVFRAINWLRKRAGKPPMLPPL